MSFYFAACEGIWCTKGLETYHSLQTVPECCLIPLTYCQQTMNKSYEWYVVY